MIPLTAPLAGYAWLHDCNVYAPVTAHALVQTETGLQFACTCTGPNGTFAGLAIEIDSEEAARRTVADHDPRFDLARAALA